MTRASFPSALPPPSFDQQQLPAWAPGTTTTASELPSTAIRTTVAGRNGWCAPCATGIQEGTTTVQTSTTNGGVMSTYNGSDQQVYTANDTQQQPIVTGSTVVPQMTQWTLRPSSSGNEENTTNQDITIPQRGVCCQGQRRIEDLPLRRPQQVRLRGNPEVDNITNTTTTTTTNWSTSGKYLEAVRYGPTAIPPHVKGVGDNPSPLSLYFHDETAPNPVLFANDLARKKKKRNFLGCGGGGSDDNHLQEEVHAAEMSTECESRYSGELETNAEMSFHTGGNALLSNNHMAQQQMLSRSGEPGGYSTMPIDVYNQPTRMMEYPLEGMNDDDEYQSKQGGVRPGASSVITSVKVGGGSVRPRTGIRRIFSCKDAPASSNPVSSIPPPAAAQQQQSTAFGSSAVLSSTYSSVYDDDQSTETEVRNNPRGCCGPPVWRRTTTHQQQLPNHLDKTLDTAMFRSDVDTTGIDGGLMPSATPSRDQKVYSHVIPTPYVTVNNQPILSRQSFGNNDGRSQPFASGEPLLLTQADLSTYDGKQQKRRGCCAAVPDAKNSSRIGSSANNTMTMSEPMYTTTPTSVVATRGGTMLPSAAVRQVSQVTTAGGRRVQAKPCPKCRGTGVLLEVLQDKPVKSRRCCCAAGNNNRRHSVLSRAPSTLPSNRVTATTEFGEESLMPPVVSAQQQQRKTSSTQYDTVKARTVRSKSSKAPRNRACCKGPDDELSEITRSQVSAFDNLEPRAPTVQQVSQRGGSAIQVGTMGSTAPSRRPKQQRTACCARSDMSRLSGSLSNSAQPMMRSTMLRSTQPMMRSRTGAGTTTTTSVLPTPQEASYHPQPAAVRPRTAACCKRADDDMSQISGTLSTTTSTGSYSSVNTSQCSTCAERRLRGEPTSSSTGSRSFYSDCSCTECQEATKGGLMMGAVDRGTAKYRETTKSERQRDYGYHIRKMFFNADKPKGDTAGEEDYSKVPTYSVSYKNYPRVCWDAIVPTSYPEFFRTRYSPGFA